MTTTARAQPRRIARMSRERMTHTVRRTLLYVLALLASVVFMGPFFWTVSSSLKHHSELWVRPPTWWPKDPIWSNYLVVWTEVPFARWMRNSIIVAALSVTGRVASASLVGYSFARFKYPGRDLIFLLTLGTVMLPVEVTLVPTYLLFSNVGWVDTFRPLIVPAFFGGGAFNIFLLRQFFMTIPRDLDDAARMDGASSLRIYWNILMPLTKPALATIAVIAFIAEWNAFMGPMIYLNSTDKFTLALGIRYFQQFGTSEGDPRQNLLMAASLIMAAIPILLFFVAQRYFVRGIVMSGIKG